MNQIIERELTKIINNHEIDCSNLLIGSIREQLHYIIYAENYEFDKSLFRSKLVEMSFNEKKYYGHMLNLYYKYNKNIIICKKCGSVGTNTRTCPLSIGCKKPCMKSHYKLYEKSL